MAGYAVPALLLIAAVAGAQLAFDRLWLTALITAVVAIVLPYGDLHGKPLVVQLARLATRGRRKRRSGYKRHRYYSP